MTMDKKSQPTSKPVSSEQPRRAEKSQDQSSRSGNLEQPNRTSESR